MNNLVDVLMRSFEMRLSNQPGPLVTKEIVQIKNCSLLMNLLEFNIFFSFFFLFFSFFFTTGVQYCHLV